MYNGNMWEFVNKVDEYLRKHYDCKIIFGRTLTLTENEYYVAFFAGEQPSAVGYTVFDSANFEQQIYDFVNSELEDVSYVQGKHDGFYEQSEGLYDEDISESEF